MAALAGTQRETIDVRTLKKFHRDVVKMVGELINTYGVRYRLDRDAVHLYLYPLGDYDAGTRGARHKVSSSRDPNSTLASLEKWVEKFVTPALLDTQSELLAAHFNDPSKVRRIKAAERAQEAAVETVAAEPTPTPEVPEIESSQASEADIPPEGWLLYTENWWVRESGGAWMCRHCPYVYEGPVLKGAHQRMHSMTVQQRKTAAGRAAKAVPVVETTQVKAARTRKLRKAVRLIEEATGVSVNSDASKLEKKIARLEADLAKVTQERDDLEARISLIREGLRA